MKRLTKGLRIKLESKSNQSNDLFIPAFHYKIDKRKIFEIIEI
jgi:hypothetical protein